MKRILYLGVILAGIITMNSCRSMQPVTNYSDAKFRSITGEVKHLPVVTNLKVKPEKVQGSFRGKGWFNKQTKLFEFDVPAAKNYAVQDAIEKYGADVFLDPLFTVTTVGEQITVTVTGYVASYSGGFRNATKEDIELLEATGDRVIIPNANSNRREERK